MIIVSENTNDSPDDDNNDFIDVNRMKPVIFFLRITLNNSRVTNNPFNSPYLSHVRNITLCASDRKNEVSPLCMYSL